MDRAQDEREPLKLRERAYDAFTQHLLARDIRPGQFVSQRELVELTGLPLGAIRELIPRLEAEGLISTVPQRGHADRPYRPHLIRDAFQFRLFLEKEAVRALRPHGERRDVRASCAPRTRTSCAAPREEITPALVAEAAGGRLGPARHHHRRARQRDHLQRLPGQLASRSASSARSASASWTACSSR